MKLAGKRSLLLEYMVIFIGTGLMAAAITSCFDAAGLVTGGFSGAAILVKEWTRGIVKNGVPLWITNLSLNIPLFILATKIKGFSFVKKALIGDMSLTMWLAVLPAWELSDDLLLSSVYGGIILGVGIGLVFLGGGTTGGTDMLAAIIQKYMRHYSIAQIMQFIDGAIVLVGNVCLWNPQGAVCDHCRISGHKGFRRTDRRPEVFKSRAYHYGQAGGSCPYDHRRYGSWSNRHQCKRYVFRSGKTDALLCGRKEGTGSAERKY